MPPTSRIADLASTIHKETDKVDAYFASNNIPPPSFDISCPPKIILPPEIQASRDAVLEASDELTALLLGPVESLIPPPNSWISIAALQRFNIAISFPPTHTSTFSSIVHSCSLPESDCRRLIPHAMTLYIFHEPSPGIVAHTAASKALAEIPALRSFISFAGEEMLPASTRLVDALAKWPGSEESNETGFALAYDTDVPMMDVIGQDPRRARQMDKAMKFLHSPPHESEEHFVENFSWDGVALLVDIGGAKGSVATAIARHIPGIKCVVQDRPEALRSSKGPKNLQDRVKFMPHNFFQEQPVKGADIYLSHSQRSA